MYDWDSIEKVLDIYRIKGKDDEWCPAVRVAATHDGDPIWVASLLYNVYSRYLDSIPDSEQNKFESDTRKALDILFDIGIEHVEGVEPEDEI